MAGGSMRCANVGAGIGFAGMLAKSGVRSGEVFTLNTDVDWHVSARDGGRLPTEWSYSIREGVGNAHAWGGVLGIPTTSRNMYGLEHFKQALSNYFTYCGKRGDNNLLASYLSTELAMGSCSPDGNIRKLLVTDSTRVKAASLKHMENFSVEKKRIRRISLKTSGVELVFDEGATLVDSLTVSAGTIETHRILAESGLGDPKGFYAEDSLFGRIGRVRFSKGVPTGLFHHHVISKSIRMKTGYEFSSDQGGALFFLQPAIRGIPASDIQLLKEYLSLKSKPSFGAALSLMTKPKLILELVLMELSMGRYGSDFDVYCVLDLGKRWYSHSSEVSAEVDLSEVHARLKKSYQNFIGYLEGESCGVETVDHSVDSPLTKNLESAYHLCGSVFYSDLAEFDSSSRVWRLKADERVAINDNSIIHGKGVVNPSLGLF